MANPRFVGASSGSWATAANWDSLAVPVNSDNVYLRNSSIDISDGFNQAAVTLTSLHQEMSYTGKVGLAVQTAIAVTSITRSSSTATVTTSSAHGLTTGNAVTISGASQTEYNGTFTITVTDTTHFTYTVSGTPATPATGTIVLKLTDYLKINATSVYLGEPAKSAGTATGSKRIRLDLGSVQSTIYVYDSSSTSQDSGEEPIRLVGTHASNKMYVSGGRVGFAMGEGDTGTLTLLTISGTGAVVNVGSGTTLATVRQSAGTATINCAVTTKIVQESGTITVNGTGAQASIAVGGTANLNTTGTITMLEVNADGHANLLGSKAARTVTDIKLYKGSTLSYDPSVVTISNPIQLIGCKPQDVTINTPAGVTVAIVKV